MARIITFALIVVTLSLTGCGVKLDEYHAKIVMENIFKARQSGDLKEELKYYAENDFTIVSFKELEKKLNTILPSNGQYLSRKHIGTRNKNETQLGQGIVKYVLVAYQVTYSKVQLIETYYFLASSEAPKLVYATFQQQ